LPPSFNRETSSPSDWLRLLNKIKRDESIQRRLDMYREVLRWNKAIDPWTLSNEAKSPAWNKPRFLKHRSNCDLPFLKTPSASERNNGKMSTSLVTGGAGFIGSHVADELLARGHKVVVLDDLSGGFEDNVPSGAVFVNGSILDVELIDRLFDRHRFNYVYHLAAYAAEGFKSFHQAL